jgi:hypothetical protein
MSSCLFCHLHFPTGHRQRRYLAVLRGRNSIWPKFIKHLQENAMTDISLSGLWLYPWNALKFISFDVLLLRVFFSNMYSSDALLKGDFVLDTAMVNRNNCSGTLCRNSGYYGNTVRVLSGGLCGVRMGAARVNNSQPEIRAPESPHAPYWCKSNAHAISNES